MENITPVSITELTNRIKSVMEFEFKFIYAEGEISNYKLHTPKGNMYFVLKDEKSAINAVMWNTHNSKLNFSPKDGLKVIVKGRISVWDTRGTYQIDVWEMNQSGLGDLQIAFERLKEKLRNEGLFDEFHKKPLPEFPENVAIITSETGAVLQDFKRVAEKRFPLINLKIFPAIMQGEGAAKTVINALKTANNPKYKIDVVCIARGGGSIEDLWAFNDESLAREIYNSKIPVVSAIGHETDFTICDFVSDKRAPTPSAAAEIILPDKNDYLERLNRFQYLIINIGTRKINSLTSDLNYIQNNYFFRKPLDTLNTFKINLDDYEEDLQKISIEKISKLNIKLNYIEKIFFNLSPENNLKRGYSIIKKGEKYISSVNELNLFDKISIKFKDGDKNAEVID
ncbi:MAG TPA: exodeoxyribonuclease VII large subunit [Ignavibacteria bacterium]|nr:exodeoxyribonuclease VII large subunit [Ignavibacteria bacterium]